MSCFGRRCEVLVGVAWCKLPVDLRWAGLACWWC